MEIEDKQPAKKAEKFIQKAGLQSSQNMLKVCDAMILIFYLILFVTCNIQHLEGKDAKYFVEMFLICIICSQVFLFSLGFTAKWIYTEDRLGRWISLRRIQNIANIVLFLLLFLSGYHEIFGFVIFIVTCPIQFLCTSMWIYTIRFDEIEERQGLMENKDPVKFGADGFNHFDEENEA
ncbi:unnamed protein product [Moneuplotes crassus]|uniref:Transmembrane protein n=1 Tax=Euplotes crassus TaxID=5936 RepID=A0AAD1Y2R5_EUPCR|nr:unnamed protein product [Moneuplotes crassus]